MPKYYKHGYIYCEYMMLFFKVCDDRYYIVCNKSSDTTRQKSRIISLHFVHMRLSYDNLYNTKIHSYIF